MRALKANLNQEVSFLCLGDELLWVGLSGRLSLLRCNVCRIHRGGMVPAGEVVVFVRFSLILEGSIVIARVETNVISFNW